MKGVFYFFLNILSLVFACDIYSQDLALNRDSLDFVSSFEEFKDNDKIKIYVHKPYVDTNDIILEIYTIEDNNFYNQDIFLYNFKNLLLSGTKNINFENLKDIIDTMFIDYSISNEKVIFKFKRELKYEALNLILDILQNSILSAKDIDFMDIEDDFSQENFNFFYNSCIFNEKNFYRKKVGETIMENTLFYRKYWKTDNTFLLLYNDTCASDITDIYESVIQRKEKKVLPSSPKKFTLKNQQGTLLNFFDTKAGQNKIFVSSFINSAPSEKEKKSARIYSKIFRHIFKDSPYRVYLDFENEKKGIVLYSLFDDKIENTLSDIEEIFKTLSLEGFYDKITDDIKKENLIFYKQDSTIFEKEVQSKFFKEFIFIKNLRILIMGNAIKFAPKLEQLEYDINFINERYNILPKPKFSLPISTNITEMDILNKYFDFLGGINVINSIYSLEKKGNIIINDRKLLIETKVMSPNKYSTEIKNQAGKVFYKNVFSSTGGYIKYDTLSEVFTIEKIKELRKKKTVFPVMMYPKAKKIKLIEKEPVNGIWCYKMKFLYDDDDVQYYYFSQEDYKVLKTEFCRIQNGKDVLKYYTIYSDYKKTDNIMLPFKEIIYNAEKKLMDIDIQQIKTNVDFESGVFD